MKHLGSLQALYQFCTTEPSFTLTLHDVEIHIVELYFHETAFTFFSAHDSFPLCPC